MVQTFAVPSTANATQTQLYPKISPEKTILKPANSLKKSKCRSVLKQRFSNYRSRPQIGSRNKTLGSRNATTAKLSHGKDV